MFTRLLIVLLDAIIVIFYGNGKEDQRGEKGQK
jgi:hypothetical protein